MQYDFDEIINRRGTQSYKWDIYEHDVLPMWVADMDFRSPPAVIEALVNRAQHGVFGYTAPPPALLAVICERMLNLYRWTIKPEDIMFLPGVVVGFNHIIQALVAPGEGVLMQMPVYHPFLPAPRNAGAKRIESRLVRTADGQYQIDQQEFCKAITPDTSLFLLCNPHNPVGRAYTHEELLFMATQCVERGIVICSDEIHSDLIFSGHAHIPIASLSPEIANQTITLMSPSKTFNIAGLDCAYAIVQNAELREKIKTAQRGVVAGVNLFGYSAALAAYQHGQDWLAQLLKYLEENRNLVQDFVTKNFADVQISPAEATYLAWLNFGSVNLPEGPYRFFLDQAKVALNDGITFGPGGEGFVRLNFGCPQMMLLEGLQRMKAAWERAGYA